MAIKLTKEQIEIVRGMGRICESFANQLYHIMENHGLDKIEGCNVVIDVCPKYNSITREIAIGEHDTPFGTICLVRGKKDEEYHIYGQNTSREYEAVFDREAYAAGRIPVTAGEKPLPPDGMWIGDDRNDPPVDCGEWDINDSLS